MASVFITPNTPTSYKDPLPAGSFYFVPANEIFEGSFSFGGIYPNVTIYYIRYWIKVVQVTEVGETQLYLANFEKSHTGSTSGNEDGYKATLSTGFSYKVYYGWQFWSAQSPTGSPEYEEALSYSFSKVVENALPLKKWTVTEGIKRLLQLAVPIRKGDYPMFVLEGDNGDGQPYTGQAAQFDTIPLPEIAMTKQTLRECLQQIGEIVHGEPRATAVKKDGKWVYQITYDTYGGEKVWKHANRPHVAKSIAQSINEYATSTDSATENLISQIKDYTGVTVEPYEGGGQSVRTETMYVRIEEGNMIIKTQRPVYFFPQENGLELYWNGNWYDCTAYLYEQSVYNTQLSAYKDDPSESKAYGLYYIRGEKNIYGLNFKQDDPFLPAFENYAIVNIIQAVTGQKPSFGTGETNSYATLIFRVRYTPFFNARVAQTKPNYRDYKYPAQLIYNQSANLVDARAFGENLKGVIARLGNAEKSHTYMLTRLKQIPKAGMKFDDDYYISAVYTEDMASYYRCTVALTKDFNRISQFIGVPSEKRYSQVSQTMAAERNVLYQEYLVIGDYVEPDSDSRIGRSMLLSFATVFSHSVAMNPVSCVVAWGESYGGQNLPAVVLSVVTCAFGNSVSFSWEYQDSYSAGAVSTWKNNGGAGGVVVTGYYQDDYRYTDYYGRMYYYNFDLRSSWTPFTEDNYLDIATSLPSASASFVPEGFFSTAGGMPYLMRKDSREKLQVNVQINLVTNRKNMIIGSALASYCAAVRGMSATDAGVARLYILPEPLNKFTDHLESYITQKLADLPYSTVTVDISGVLNNNDGYFTITGTAAASGKAWAIVTPQTTTTEQVEDEEGDVGPQTVTHGGDLLLGENMEISSGEAIPTIYFTKKEEVFDKTVWKDIR